MLDKNGSAVDAAIAAGLCNGVVNMQSMGLGGGHFMHIYIKYTTTLPQSLKNKKNPSNSLSNTKRSENKSYFINARETAPEHAHREMFVAEPAKSLTGGLST
jgi:gamma-glutamyltranspeptidase/glutathione hydrolase/leukotriene-C4 hydrolase